MDECTEGASASEAWDVVAPATLTDLPSGDHFLVVTSAPWASSTDCGAYQLTADLEEIPDGDCVAPLSFRSGARHAGDTCGASNPLPSIDPFPSPQPDLVYRIDPADVVDGRLYFDAPGLQHGGDAGLVLLGRGETSSPPTNLPPASPASWTCRAFPAATAIWSSRHRRSSPTTVAAVSVSAISTRRLRPTARSFSPACSRATTSRACRQAPPGATPQRMDFARNGYAYSVTPAGTNATLQFATSALGRPLQALSVASASAPRSLRIAFSGAPVNAVGGRFWQTRLPALAEQGVLTVSVRSGTRVKTYRIRGSDDFRGFRSSRAIDEIAIAVNAGSARPTIDDFVVGYAQTP